MHENNILKIQDETIKVISEVQKLLENTEKFKKEYEILENEKKKVGNLEFVISFVGTVKAGKSTTINAIVGQEILPHRTAAMTTLPTLITHKNGQNEPILTMPKNELLNNFLKKVKKELENNKKTESVPFLQNSHGKEIAKELSKKDFEFRNSYKNREEIFEFLKTLNDLMRLAKDLKLEPPYCEFEKIDELPRIEVEFYCLRDKENVYNAKLSLLDTPGPNESGHSEELEKVFATQLEQSSAVAFLIDYSNRNSTDSANIRKEIEKIQEKEHLFVLLNKFDANTSADADYEQTKEDISKSMFNKTIKDENIFPISSKNAYFANLGNRELELSGKIDKTLFWAKDFGKGVLGDLWEEEIENIEKVKKICDLKYKNSHFEKALNKIIVNEYSNTIFKLLGNALEEVENKNVLFLNNFKENENSLKNSMETLKIEISNLKNDIENISNIKNSLDKDIKNEFERLHKVIKNEKEDLLKNLKKISFFKESQQQQQQQGEDIIFEDEKIAREFILQIENKLKKEISNISNSLNTMLENQVNHFIPILNEKIEKDIGIVLEEIKKSVGDNISIKIPSLKFNNYTNSNNSLSDIIEKKEKGGYFRESDGIPSWFGRGIDTIFGTKLGYDYVPTYHEYKVSKKNISKRIEKVSDNFSNVIKQNIDDIFSNQIQKEIMESLNRLISEIENFRELKQDIIKKNNAGTLNVEKEIVSAKENQEILKRLNERIEITISFLKEISNAK